VQLEGKVALVTGSSCGIGKGIAISFAREGAKIIIDHYRNNKDAEEVVGIIEKNGGSAISIDADVSIKKEVENLVNTGWERFGKIDILVNNAGIAPSTAFLEIKEEEWNRTINVNLKGTFLCSQIVAKKMVENKIKGKIIVTTSINGFQAEKKRVSYDSSKGGLIALMHTMASELGDYGINVNAIAPGVVSGTNIDVEGDFFGNKDIVDKILSKTPLHRFGSVEDCANLAVFLASDKSDFIHGEVIVLDGGLTVLQFP
jgi:NAD(P)-dependent dehydrogenase (short-subunit alcohol dehydrogenase family)